jgi:hypothetical protein
MLCDGISSRDPIPLAGLAVSSCRNIERGHDLARRLTRMNELLKLCARAVVLAPVKRIAFRKPAERVRKSR